MSLANRTITKHILSKAFAGVNSVPDWVENYPIGVAPTGSPYLDSVRFSLFDNINIGSVEEYLELGPYINSTVSVSNNVKIAKTNINGRKTGPVKQFISQNDYNIIFNIDIFGEFSPEGPLDDNININQVGRTNRNEEYRGNYYPDAELQKINEFLNRFYSDDTIQYINVESSYLNDNFNISRIIPHSIKTKQNHKFTNTYSLIIKAYSEFSDDDPSIDQEIIPAQSSMFK
jgi:hypothetical protein